ncbi:MAG: aminotransferase class I/II-fold pyridoxal phosphate-dependent enzyme [Suipraeoptans sp.]
MSEILDKLVEYSESDYYGFHMPGHKRNTEIVGNKLPYDLDITEIEGFDDLNHPRGMLLEARKRASKLYGSKDTFFLVNGSTVGILSSIRSILNNGDTILVARNCHKSVYNAINLFGIKAQYIYPSYDKDSQLYGSIDSREVAEIIKDDKNIKAMVMVSPTYDGVVSDIASITKVLHQNNIPLILDEAHGAHFGMNPMFPTSGNKQGADVVIHSLHKTMPALTQSAIMHVNGILVDVKKLERTLYMLQSSSPSYILMASIDNCISFAMSERGMEEFGKYAMRLAKLRHKLTAMKNLKIIETSNYDKSKIVISTNNTDITSYELYHTLNDKFHLQMEMYATNYCLGITSVCDTEEGLNRLAEALLLIDSKLKMELKPDESEQTSIPRTQKVYDSSEMTDKNTEMVELANCEGRIAMEPVYVYPPGIPILVPGERVSKDCINVVQCNIGQKLNVEGVHNNCIKVLSDE